MKLLIVESPGKIEKLKSILGTDWEVAASYGHIRDIPTEVLGIDKINKYKLSFQIYPDKTKTVSFLRSIVGKVGKENVYVGSDDDREGEAIAFHLCEALGLDWKVTKRVTFKEITKTMVTNAINNPRLLDVPLVAAQQARRAIDRLMGYEISPLLWKKLPDGCKSAGRVQSAALRLVVERERAINRHEEKASFLVKGVFQTVRGHVLFGTLDHKFKEEVEAKSFLESSVSKRFSISDIKKTQKAKEPNAPFTTSTLQVDASRKLKLNVTDIMKVAQTLYESGHITYMRTDSVNLSEEAIEGARVQISNQFGNGYFKKRVFKNKSENAQEAHEAIRPTHFEVTTISGNASEKALYSLIRNRALASQMSAAIIDHCTISILSSVGSDLYLSNANSVHFDGFLAVYEEASESDDKGEEEENVLVDVLVGDSLERISLLATQTYTMPPNRFDQATMVIELEKIGIGRPSTYAPTISTLLDRKYISEKSVLGKKVSVVTYQLENSTIKKLPVNYITIGGDKMKLVPSENGLLLTDFLEKSFADMVDFKFTASIEENFDKIANGKATYFDTVKEFDLKLSALILNANSSYKTLEKERKTRDLGSFENEIVVVGKGEFGTYVAFKKTFFTIEGKEPEFVTLDDAIFAINAKRNSLSNEVVLAEHGKKYKIIQKDKGIFIKDGSLFVKLPPFIKDIAELNEDKCKSIVANFKKWKKKNDK